MRKTKNVVHYGLQRSGTNYLESLLKANLEIKVVNSDAPRDHPLHKHFRLYDNKEMIPEPKFSNSLTFDSFKQYEHLLNINESLDAILVLSKDPYSWLLSYQKWAKKCNWPQQPYHYIDEYVMFYDKWNRFRKEDDRIHLIRYHDLLLCPEKEMETIQNKFDVPSKLIRKILGRKSHF